MAPVGGGSAGTLAVERWAAEKRLQRKVENLRTKLNEKSRELSVAEDELAKSRSALEGATKREAAMREGMVHAQEQLSRANRDREGALTGALTDMRSREELSNELHRAQSETARLKVELRTQRAAGLASGASPSAAAGGGEVEVEEEEESLRGALLQRDQRILEQGFALEAHELTIAQLQARLRDQQAYQSVLGSASGAPAASSAHDAASPQRRPRSAGPGGGGGGPGAAGERVGREEMNVVVEKMERVISNLQSENAELRKKAVSTLKYVEINKKCKELEGACDALRTENSELAKRLESAREEAAAAGRTSRERDEARRNLKAEGEKTAALREKLADAQEARATAEAGRAVAEATLAGEGSRGGESGGGRGSARAEQLDIINKQLEGQLRGARAEGRSLRDELVSKGTLLVDIGSQLTQALDAAAASDARAANMQAEAEAGRQVAELLGTVEAERDALRDAFEGVRADEERRQAEHAEMLASVPRAAAADAAAGAVAEAMASENATLRAENAAMASELSSLSPQFFEEVEDLKYAFATAQQTLERYAREYGPLGP